MENFFNAQCLMSSGNLECRMHNYYNAQCAMGAVYGADKNQETNGQ